MSDERSGDLGADDDRPDRAADEPGADPRDEAPVRDEDVVDELPADLDVTELDDYVFPNNNKRRIVGVLYLAIAVVCIGLWALVGDESALVNVGFLAAGLGLAAVGVYSLIAGWDLAVDEQEALTIASRAAGFPAGHASAQMGWRGWLSRPTWRILLFSNEPQPVKRALVLIDGVDGEVLDQIVEDNPEDFSQF